MTKTIEKIAIHAGKDSEKIIAFATQGYGMSDCWWADTQKARENGCLHGVYQTASGKLRRTTF